MLYVTIILVIIIIIYFFYSSGRRNYISYINKAVSIAHTSIALFLLKEYKQQYDDDTASAYASAITNILFCDEPSNERGRIFLEQNKNDIFAKMKELKQFKIIVNIMSITSYMLGEVLFLRKSEKRAKWLISTSDLQKDGIILRSEEITIPKSGEEFIKIAVDFKKWVEEYN